MNAFPRDYVVHNLPLLILSGLETELPKQQDASDQSKVLLREGGFQIKTDAPPISAGIGAILRDAFLERDASTARWNGRAISAKELCGGYRIRSVGRTYTLPPRKAPPPPHSPRLSPTSEGPPRPLVLHSTISPLTSTSPLYPDGVFTPIWITKHQARLPAIFMTFFPLAADPNQSSLQDNVLKSEVNNIRNTISSTNYRTKLVVVLLGNDAIAPSTLDERISNIKKFCNLDAKSLYYLPAASSQIEITDFVQTLLSTLHPTCVEYYRDLSKHARRKRNRGSPPLPTTAPTTGISQMLPMQGWNARYEFKLGVFAEFRQEMDAACRNYESAYESLFSPEIFQPLANGSPQFNEARMLADVIAVRIIRCQLWTEQPTGAIRSWRNHRDRIKSIVDGKGDGTNDYAWESWESTWSKTMAEMVARVDLSSLSMLDSQSQIISPLFAPPEKVLPIGERIAPWEMLHHTGYWLVIALKHIRKRRDLAFQRSGGDPKALGRSVSSLVGTKAHAHASYLYLEQSKGPSLMVQGGYDYRSDMNDTLQAAMDSFAARGQLRTNERLRLEEAIDLLDEEAWTNAAAILGELWMNTRWRTAGWWNLLSKLGWALYQCAVQLQDQETVIHLMWELSCCVFPVVPDFKYDLHTALSAFEQAELRPNVVLGGHDVVSSILPTFAFVKSEGNVGQPLEAQLCLTCQMQPGAGHVRFAEVKVVFEGGLRPVHLLHDEAVAISKERSQILNVDLQDSSSLTASSKKRSSAGAIASLSGNTDLNVGPGETKIYAFGITPKEAGEVKVASITMIVEDTRFNLTVVFSDLADAAGYWWQTKDRKPMQRPFGMERDVTEVKILPKPPMVRLQAHELRTTYYTNEPVELQVDVVNDEEETVALSIQARLISSRAHAASLRWRDQEGAARPESESEVGVLVLPSREVGELSPSASSSMILLMDNTLDALDHELEVIARYRVASDPETPLIKVSTFDLPFIRPFEANYNFSARYHNETWPNFFKAPDTDAAPATGLKQWYLVKASVYSFASEELHIDSANLVVHRIAGGAICDTSPGRRKTDLPYDNTSQSVAGSKAIVPDETQEFCFDLMAQKIKLGDRDAVSLDLTLELTWRRPGSSSSTVSSLELPRFIAPMAEPRVLLVDAIPLPQLTFSPDFAIYQLLFTLENASMHFLTFNITMESSEDFAFAGPKATSVSLVPISRHTVEYRLLFSKTGVWIGINLRVVDAYFGKQLRVLPAGDCVKADKKGAISVWLS